MIRPLINPGNLKHLCSCSPEVHRRKSGIAEVSDFPCEAHLGSNTCAAALGSAPFAVCQTCWVGKWRWDVETSVFHSAICAIYLSKLLISSNKLGFRYLSTAWTARVANEFGTVELNLFSGSSKITIRCGHDDHDGSVSVLEIQMSWRSKWIEHLPSGKHLHSYRKSTFFMGKSTISMAIFNSQLLVITRGYTEALPQHPPRLRARQCHLGMAEQLCCVVHVWTGRPRCAVTALPVAGCFSNTSPSCYMMQWVGCILHLLSFTQVENRELVNYMEISPVRWWSGDDFHIFSQQHPQVAWCSKHRKKVADPSGEFREAAVAAASWELWPLSESTRISNGKIHHF